MQRNVVLWILAVAVAGVAAFAVLYGDSVGWGAGLTLGVSLGAFALAVAGYAVWERVRARRRRAAAPAVATSMGLLAESSGGTPLPRFPAFELTSKGSEQRAENVMSGQVGQGRVWLFDYTYSTEQSYSDSRGQMRTYRRDHDFSCALVELPAPLPAMLVARDTVFSRQGHEDVTVGASDFDPRFRVEAAAPEVARQLFDPSVRDWLLSVEDRFVFEVADRWLLAYDRQRDMDHLRPLLDAAVGVRDRLPRHVVTSDQARAAARGGGAVLPPKATVPFLALIAMFLLVMAATTMGIVAVAAFTDLEEPELGLLLTGGAGVSAVLAVVVPLWARAASSRRRSPGASPP